MQVVWIRYSCSSSSWPCVLLRRGVLTRPTCATLSTSLHALSPQVAFFNLKVKAMPQTPGGARKTVFGASADPLEVAKRELVSKRLERTARYLRRLGTLGFWGQLVCSLVSTATLAFSVAISGSPTSQTTFYTTAGGIIAAFVSVFWSFGYIRVSERLRSTVNDLRRVPSRAEVVKNLQNGVSINFLGFGLALLGLKATVGTLVAKSLTSMAVPYMHGTPAVYSPILALDVFLVQASANTLLSHFLGLVLSIELLRSIMSSQPPPDYVLPKIS